MRVFITPPLEAEFYQAVGIIITAWIDFNLFDDGRLLEEEFDGFISFHKAVKTSILSPPSVVDAVPKESASVHSSAAGTCNPFISIGLIILVKGTK